MIEIHFQESLDALKLYERLCSAQQERNINYIDVLYEQENIITICIDKKSNELVDSFIIPVITSFFIETKEDIWMLSMMQELFYFSDFEERQQILEIARSIIEGERKGIPVIADLVPREELISTSLSTLLTDSISFSFESFIKFRLKDYSDRLLQYVEISIDEYKLEQEYQNFIQNLRDYITERDSKLEHVNILHNDQFLLFSEQFSEIKRDEVIKYIDRKLIQSYPMYIDSSIIAPLVSMNPSSINLYTNQVDDGMVQTIRNIFQERVRIFSKKEFIESQHLLVHKKI
ncbi:putative sporulation protein YtxC [Bacillus luteolus]|uniref:Sporulation protein YtxC n=1 Tax=Litchfieldia luteola TaxID=682179 RepID=A0ABR9QIB0_9BACI|nr:putative sporulation protein YtxC [Cytobacillus luteolus]MBE4908226.1 putative sporulation protein YtxC [Cytobacillus luteolus]MBP1943012.1 putative sporulation protein YtxC [Cytobacillus luteolus]